MFDFNIFTTDFEEKNWQNQMRIPKLISTLRANIHVHKVEGYEYMNLYHIYGEFLCDITDVKIMG